MYFPDNVAGLTALSERVDGFVLRWRTAIGRKLRKTGRTLAETPPERWGLSVARARQVRRPRSTALGPLGWRPKRPGAWPRLLRPTSSR